MTGLLNSKKVSSMDEFGFQPPGTLQFFGPAGFCPAIDSIARSEFYIAGLFAINVYSGGLVSLVG